MKAGRQNKILRTTYNISLWLFFIVFWLTLLEYIDRIGRESIDELQLWFGWCAGSAIAIILMLCYRRKILNSIPKKTGIYKIIFFFFVMFTFVETIYLYQKFNSSYGNYTLKIRILNSIFFFGLFIITGIASHAAGIWRRTIKA